MVRNRSPLLGRLPGLLLLALAISGCTRVNHPMGDVSPSPKEELSCPAYLNRKEIPQSILATLSGLLSCKVTAQQPLRSFSSGQVTSYLIGNDPTSQTTWWWVVLGGGRGFSLPGDILWLERLNVVRLQYATCHSFASPWVKPNHGVGEGMFIRFWPIFCYGGGSFFITDDLTDTRLDTSLLFQKRRREPFVMFGERMVVRAWSVPLLFSRLQYSSESGNRKDIVDILPYFYTAGTLRDSSGKIKERFSSVLHIDSVGQLWMFEKNDRYAYAGVLRGYLWKSHWRPDGSGEHGLLSGMFGWGRDRDRRLQIRLLGFPITFSDE